MKKEWRRPALETVTSEELEEIVTAAGCSVYHICVAHH